MLIYVFYFIRIFMQYYRFYINPVHFMFNHLFIINFHILNLFVISMQCYHFFINLIQFKFDYSII